MPTVKKLHQESGLNSKPDYFFGHSCQVIAVLLGRMKSIFAVPLIRRIYEGVVFTICRGDWLIAQFTKPYE